MQKNNEIEIENRSLKQIKDDLDGSGSINITLQ
jgi:hypothetical protein